LCHTRHDRAIVLTNQHAYAGSSPSKVIAINGHRETVIAINFQQPAQRGIAASEIAASKEEACSLRLTDGFARLAGSNTNMTTPGYGSPQPRVRILVADDHEVMRLGIRNLLEGRAGWSVCAEANNGQEAVEKTTQFQPDVIVMDINMPVMNGLEAASQITKKEPQIPVILFSLHLSDDLHHHFRRDGIRGAVAKADAARDLILAVETVLRGGTFFPGQNGGSN
jgi:CheY-like chemotaxis protein